ncbi:MAG: helix-turn-helix transcriptional regulator [Clostridia bacterium]|nr:helix-turn-helix transcriptional regulator [Clostridia bacterium]
MVNIGKRLKEARKGKATQLEIAELLLTTQQQISKYENDIQEIPCRHIISLAKYLNVSTDYLLGLTDSKDKYW